MTPEELEKIRTLTKGGCQTWDLVHTVPSLLTHIDKQIEQIRRIQAAMDNCSIRRSHNLGCPARITRSSTKLIPGVVYQIDFRDPRLPPYTHYVGSATYVGESDEYDEETNEQLHVFKIRITEGFVEFPRKSIYV